MKDSLYILIYILKDPIVYIPAIIIVGIICLSLYKYSWNDIKQYWILTTVAGFIVIILFIFLFAYTNHNFININMITENEKIENVTIAVLPFDNVNRDAQNNANCFAFRNLLTTYLDKASEELNVSVVNYTEITADERLQNNNGLTYKEAIHFGKKFKADYIVFGQILPLRYIQINVKVVQVDSGDMILDFDVRRRIIDIPALAEESSVQILYAWQHSSQVEKEKARDRLSSVRTSIRAGKFFAEGLNEYHRKNFKGAILALRKAIDEDSDFADPHLLLAYIYFYEKEDELAIDELKTTITKNPKWPEAHYFLGVVYKRNERYKEALEQYQEALKVERRLAYKILYETAVAGVLLKLGRKEEAQAIIDNIENTETKHRKILYNLAARYCEIGNLEKSLSLLKQSVESGLSIYDCKAALADPDFRNLRSDPKNHRRFLEIMEGCQ